MELSGFDAGAFERSFCDPTFLGIFNFVHDWKFAQGGVQSHY